MEKNDTYITLTHQDLIGLLFEKQYLKGNETIYRIIQKDSTLILQLAIDNIPKKVLDLPIKELDFISSGLYDILKKSGVETIKDILELQPKNILRLANGEQYLIRLTQSLMFISTKYKLEEILEVGMYAKDTG